MNRKQQNRLEKLMKDYYDTEMKAIPDLQQPRFAVKQKSQASWIPALAFNLLLAVCAVFIGLGSSDFRSPLEHKISELNTTYAIEKSISRGLYALKNSYTIWRNK